MQNNSDDDEASEAKAGQEVTRPLDTAGIELKLSPESEKQEKAMEGFTPDASYRNFENSLDQIAGQPSTTTEREVPLRYKTKGKSSEEKERLREARRTRRTVRLEQEQQKKREKVSEDTHYKISYSSSSEESSVDENYDVTSIAESEVESLTWRGKMQHALHHNLFHLIIVILVSIDAVIVIFELLIDVGAFSNVRCEGSNFLEQAETCHYRASQQCGPHAMMILEGVNISESAGGNGANEDICRCGFRNGQRVCILRPDPLGVNPALILHYFSLAILTTFLFEIALKFIAFRLKYFTHKFEVFDGAIVVISWILDVASVVEEEAFEAAALLIVLRLWRVIRIVNGAILSSKSQSDKDLEERRNEARKIIHAFHKAQDRMDDYEAETFDLHRKIRHLEKEKASHHY